jgi:hypothetical protein
MSKYKKIIFSYPFPVVCKYPVDVKGIAAEMDGGGGGGGGGAGGGYRFCG